MREKKIPPEKVKDAGDLVHQSVSTAPMAQEPRCTKGLINGESLAAFAAGNGERCDQTPKTGDDSNLVGWLALSVISAGGVVALGTYSRRRKNRIND